MVIRLLMIEGQTPEDVASQLSITVANLYNIKRRAILALTEVALKDKSIMNDNNIMISDELLSAF